MHRSWKFAVPMAIVVIWGSSAYSAGHPFMLPDEDTVEIMLLRQKSVRDELKIGNDVAARIDQYAMAQWRKAQEVVNLSEKEQAASFDMMAKENQQFLDKNLTKEQRARLNAITLQVVGLLYVTRRDIADRLKLTAEQKERARQLQGEARRELENLIEARDARERQKELAALWQRNHDRLFDVLTDAQEVTWKQMTGATFKGEFTYSYIVVDE